MARLDLFLDDTGRWHRYRHDAARRAALALARLDGWQADEQDLLVALASPGDVPLPRRAEAVRAAGLAGLLTDLQGGAISGHARATGERPPRHEVDPPGKTGSWQDLTVAIRRDLRLAEEVLAESEMELDSPPQASLGPVEPVRVQPWSLDWVEELWRRWRVVLTGTEQGPLDREAMDCIETVLGQIQKTLTVDPGLVGVARVLHRLHWADEWPEPERPPLPDDADERSRAFREQARARPEPSWWPWFARLTAPLLIRRACHLQHVWLPLPCAFAADVSSFRAGLAIPENDWIERFGRWVADYATAEEDRAARREQRFAGLREQALRAARRPLRPVPGKATGQARQRSAAKRRSNSRIPALLDFLSEQPVVSAVQVQQRIGIAYRNALTLIQDLERQGLLQEVTGRGAFRLWRLTGLD